MIAPFAVFADVLLRAEAAASAYVGEIDVATLVGRLPSFEVGETRRSAVEAVREEVATARGGLLRDRASSASAFARVARSADLSDDEVEVLAIAAAVETNTDRQRLVANLNGDATALRVTIGLIERLLGSAGVAALSPSERLASSGLISLGHGTTFARSEIQVASELSFLLAAGAMPSSLRRSLLLDACAEATEHRLVLVPGKDAIRGRQVAHSTLGGPAMVVQLPTEPSGWVEVVRAATLGGRSVILHIGDELQADGRDWIERADHLRWALVSSNELPIDQLPNRPWSEVRPADASATADELADAFGPDSPIAHRLTAHQAHLAGRAFDGVDADKAVRRLASGELDRLAVRVRARRSWDDLVLPPEQLALVRGVVERYHHRSDVYERWGFRPVPSAGVIAMFSGPPGTGKTLSAEVVAAEIGLDLYRIDLSSMVSKYIGETEKNLDKVFRAAEGGTMVLLFDEADAVFGKRSEVSDANDRYANVETSYLLQRLENYDGVVILTTNYASNIDNAFMRRIHVSVEFTPPDETERLRLWAQSFPPDAPLADLDLPLLAKRFKLSGSAIRSVSIGAAFRAAAAGEPIGMGTIVEALRAELRKQGRVATTGDLLSEPEPLLTARGSRRP